MLEGNVYGESALAGEGVKNKQSIESIRERILAEDKAVQKLVGRFKSHLVYVKTVLENSVQGFIDFTETAQS